MSSIDGSSIPEGAAGGADGGEGSAKDGANGKCGRAKKVSSTPRQSAAVLLQLKVIRKALERLMTERNQLDDVKMNLQTSADDLEKEIARVSKMRDIAQEASNFQHGRPHEAIMQFLACSNSSTDEDGPLPGSSAAITDGSSASPTALQNITNEFLFGLPNDPAIPMMDDTGASGFEGLDYYSHIINDLGMGIETFPHEMVQQTVRDMKIEDTSGDEAEDENQF